MFKSRSFSFLFGVVLVLVLAVTACTTATPTATAEPATQVPTQAAEQATATSPSPSETPTASATETATAPAPGSMGDIILATTTSTQDSGLLDVLVPAFEKQTGYILKVVAVGTGQALTMGQQCNADVLLVHAPSSEVDFMNNGYGSERYLVMHNDFIIVGPKADPAGVKSAKTAVEAFQKMAQAKAIFISRGDKSGTNTMELGLWKKANITPAGDWYRQSGQGMGATLRIASELGGYTLTDRATYLANQSTLSLDILSQGDPGLLNVYHVIVVNPAKCPQTNLKGAQAFAQFMIAPDTQKNLIATFGVDKYGQALFFADADKTDAQLGLQ
jgi:tungstate transport system substrate-binding protein